VTQESLNARGAENIAHLRPLNCGCVPEVMPIVTGGESVPAHVSAGVAHGEETATWRGQEEVGVQVPAASQSGDHWGRYATIGDSTRS
jgi:hypothetical protein